MITTLFRTPVRPSISARWDGLRVSASRPATTARPSREPCDVRIRNRMSLSPFIFFASACDVVASVSTVALPPVLVLYFTTTESPPNRLATICAAPVASRRKTPSSPNRPNDTTVILRGFSAACTAFLNICELIAVGIKKRAFSKSVSKAYWGDVIPKSYRDAKQLIDDIRRTPEEGSRYTYI